MGAVLPRKQGSELVSEIFATVRTVGAGKAIHGRTDHQTLGNPMSVKSSFRRAVALAGLMLLTVGTTALVAAPAHAELPASQLSVSPTTVHPGDTVTITQTVTNNLVSTLLSPVAQLVSVPDGLASFTALVGCAGVASCGVLNNGSGQPIGYQAILPSSLNPLGGNAVVTYTLQILPDAPDLQETLQGRLLGLNFLSDLLSGPTLIIDANADVAVSVAATPKLGVLSPTLDVAVTVTNNGPGQFLLGAITTTVPADLLPVGVPPCVGVPGVGIPGLVTCVVPLLAKGASTTLRFSIPLNLLSIGLPYTFTSSRSLSVSRDLNSANDTASTTCLVVSRVLVLCS
jgi:hypothetical protein